MAWNYNATSTEDFLNNYMHELDKYKSEFRKIKTEIEKDDDITVNNLISVEPGIKEIKRNRKRFAEGTSLPITHEYNKSDGFYDDMRASYVTLPISFTPGKLWLRVRVLSLREDFSVFVKFNDTSYMYGYIHNTYGVSVRSDMLVDYIDGDKISQNTNPLQKYRENEVYKTNINAKNTKRICISLLRNNPPNLEIISWFATE